MNRIVKSFGGIVWLILIVTYSSCLSDIRSPMLKQGNPSEANISKGKLLLDEVWKKQGFEHLKKHKVYEFEATDNWQGMMGKMGKPWPDAKVDMSFKFEVGSFDGNVAFQSGKKKGLTAGLQSWNYYEKDNEGQPRKLKTNEKIRFGLSAYQYFIELADRLRSAPIITYAGSENMDGKKFETVFVTWHKLQAHRQNDQYKLYIDPSTSLLSYVVYTTRESYLKMPGGQLFYGSIKFDEYEDVEGFLVPHRQTVFLNAPKSDPSDFVHQMIISKFKFDSFEPSELKPFPEVKATGNSKSKG